MACPIFNAQEKESYILKINWIVNTFILNESSKHPKLTLKASSTSSISYSSNRSKYLINFDLSIVLILQNDSGNYFSSTTIVASLTSHVAKKGNLPTHVFINSREDLEHDSIIMCEQIRTIDKSKLIRYLDRLDEYEMVNFLFLLREMSVMQL